MRAGQAGSLRLEVETVRVAEQEKALSEARQHLQQWDCLVRAFFSLAHAWSAAAHLRKMIFTATFHHGVLR